MFFWRVGNVGLNGATVFVGAFFVFAWVLEALRGFGAYLGVHGSFRKLGVPYFGVLIIRILVFRVLY